MKKIALFLSFIFLSFGCTKKRGATPEKSYVCQCYFIYYSTEEYYSYTYYGTISDSSNAMSACSEESSLTESAHGNGSCYLK